MIARHAPFLDGSKHAANEYCPTCHGSYDRNLWDADGRLKQQQERVPAGTPQVTTPEGDRAPMMKDKHVLVTLELTEHHAQALARFVKRIGWSEIRGNASTEGEAYLTREAIDQIGRELADAGYAPR